MRHPQPAGSNAATTSATALNRLVDGSNAPPASQTALDLLVDGSNAARVGDTTDAGSAGDDGYPPGNGARGDSSISPMHNQLFSIFQQATGGKNWEFPIYISYVNHAQNTAHAVKTR